MYVVIYEYYFDYYCFYYSYYIKFLHTKKKTIKEKCITTPTPPQRFPHAFELVYQIPK